MIFTGRGTSIRGTRSRLLVIGLGLVLFFLSTASLFWYFEHEHPVQRELLRTPVDVLYWWTITCTTVGYGDISPKTQAGKVLVVIVVLVGVSMVTAVVAKAGSMFIEQRMQLLRGFGHMKHHRNHILVCGWSEDLAGILGLLLEYSRDTSAEDIVLLNGEDPDRVNTLRSRPEFKGLELVSGDHTNRSDLERAGASRARAAMVLADTGAADPDSRTLLGVMALRQANKTAHVCAEVREDRFVQYIRDAGADEVIDPSTFRRAMASQILVSPGMGNVFYDLLSLESGAFFDFEPLDEQWNGRTYGELRDEYCSRRDVTLVGLVEHVGNPLEMKREALREAQKAPDVGKLVTQLRDVKALKPNSPCLSPPPEHTIGSRTSAVVIHRNRPGVQA